MPVGRGWNRAYVGLRQGQHRDLSDGEYWCCLQLRGPRTVGLDLRLASGKKRKSERGEGQAGRGAEGASPHNPVLWSRQLQAARSRTVEARQRKAARTVVSRRLGRCFPRSREAGEAEHAIQASGPELGGC